MLTEARVALIHDWLTGMRGGERCLETLCELFPGADIFTLLHVKGSVSKTIEERRIRTSAIQSLPFAAGCYRYYLPLFPWAIERLTLDRYDLILSSSHCVAKGVKPPPDALHIAYLYTPMRYIWDMQDAYIGSGRMGPVSRLMLRAIAERLRRWDIGVNTRVDHFVAISQHVADRIRRHYGREAAVIYPPVETTRFHIAERTDDYYLVAGAFAPYKRIDLAIEAFNRLGRRLVIVGEGQESRRLRHMAGPTIEFLGWRPDSEVADLLSRCHALVFPGEEDFGILPVEAMACGRPVIAYGKGGVTETVIPLDRSMFDVQCSEPHHTFSLQPSAFNPEPRPPTGVFFDEQTVEALIQAIDLFEQSADRFDPEALRTHALTFDRSIFEKRIANYIGERFEEWKRAGRRRLC
ncbi:glycosyltransferase [Candidatus Methylomirabilis sp.]|uniref:glycosyltransferase n=1 Tax=Candidatus Methylomirabilis sp. TaxID=2032687 RepID=UPI002A5C10D3|nr:glycosyltransferase [Candidatus Methylomirabilis sp.]